MPGAFGLPVFLFMPTIKGMTPIPQRGFGLFGLREQYDVACDLIVGDQGICGG